METSIEDVFYTAMEDLCDKVDYLFTTYDTDAFMHYLHAHFVDNIVALNIIHYAFMELDSDDRVEFCRSYIARDCPDIDSSAAIDIINSMLQVLKEWEQRLI